jgi:phosphoesterase RecJ-like protein
MKYPEADKLAELVSQAKKILIIQADNPDADSLGSALALEQILADLNKDTALYCGVDMPGYLRYMEGWDRVERDVPNDFDLSIIVDASTMTLLEKIAKTNQLNKVSSKNNIVLDHHGTVEKIVPFANVMINDGNRSSAGELIYVLAKQLNWPINLKAQEFIMSSILGDTQGLSNQLASPETYEIMAAMIRAGIDRPELEEKRKQSSKMAQMIFRYKADLIKRTDFYNNGSLAIVVVDQIEINNFSPLYNPAALIQGDMLQTQDVKLCIVLKRYDDSKVTAAIRANPGAAIAAELAEYFGGGGHKFASGFKIDHVDDFEKIKNDCISKASELLNDKNS